MPSARLISKGNVERKGQTDYLPAFKPTIGLCITSSIFFALAPHISAGIGWRSLPGSLF
jgi:hypothetical protein